LLTVSDEDLVAGFLAGDQTCFDRIVARYRRSLCRFARAYLGKAGHLAEDVAQEALVAAYRSIRSFVGRSSFRTWLYAVARNACRHEMRRRRLEPEEVVDADATLLAIPDLGPDPLRCLESQETGGRIRDAVDALPAPLRTVLLLRDAEGLSYDDIARVLSVPLGTVRSRLHNARAMLVRTLAGLRRG
jgi:RNA polymerase sigma-70 factor (ECF subfamily)